MKLWIMSDMHLDVGRNRVPFELPDQWPEHDVVVIPGDIREKVLRGIQWIVESGLNNKPVIYVAGNHEFYGRAMDTDIEKAREIACDYHNVFFLEDDYIDIDGVRFIGATLWTDYLLYGEGHRSTAMMMAENCMNDHRKIRLASTGYGKFLPKHAAVRHHGSRRYLERMLGEPFDGPRVVVTHHAPSIKSLDLDRFDPADILNAAYASNLSALVNESNLWIHGHIHAAKDYLIGNGRVIVNPRGYECAGEKTGFNPALVVNLADIKKPVEQAVDS